MSTLAGTFAQLRPPYPAPLTDDVVEQIVDDAIADLGAACGLAWLGDAAAELHLLASLVGHIHRRLPEVVRDARDQDLSWEHIATLVGLPAPAARRRYDRPENPSQGAPIEP